MTGSSATNDQKIHVFVLNSQNDLRYFYIPLAVNGLPQPADNGITLNPNIPLIDVNGHQVNCAGETKICSTFGGGGVTAVAYQGNLYVFYVSRYFGDNNIAAFGCYWRATANDTGSWTLVVGHRLCCHPETRMLH